MKTSKFHNLSMKTTLFIFTFALHIMHKYQNTLGGQLTAAHSTTAFVER